MLKVLLNQTLSLAEHTHSVYKKATSRLYLLKRVRHQQTTEAALTLFKTMLVPIFTYCSILTCNYTEAFERRIKSFERRALFIIYQNRNSPEVKKVSIRRLQKRRLCTQVYNCINGKVCNNLKKYFDVMSNNTRNSQRILRLPLTKI